MFYIHITVWFKKGTRCHFPSVWMNKTVLWDSEFLLILMLKLLIRFTENIYFLDYIEHWIIPV
jgi:hypothetical protein